MSTYNVSLNYISGIEACYFYR